MRLLLQRGIATAEADAERIVESIRNKGLHGSEGTWEFRIPDISVVRKRLEIVFAAENPSVEDVFSETPFRGICACGDEIGARHYAIKHNRSEERPVAILLTFEANIDDVYVDCRDFLCSAFQFWDREATLLKERQASILRNLYGDGILRYFERCVSTPDQDVRIAMCNLASFDARIVKDHYLNKNVIGGRYGTRFCSAFFVKDPVTASAIKRCELICPRHHEFELYVDIYEFDRLES